MSTDTKFTKGPWGWWTSNSLMRLTAKGGMDGGVLHAVRLRDGSADIEVSEANARLISAAPDMYAALRIAIRQNSHDMLMTGEELRQCEAALAKARGEG